MSDLHDPFTLYHHLILPFELKDKTSLFMPLSYSSNFKVMSRSCQGHPKVKGQYAFSFAYWGTRHPYKPKMTFTHKLCVIECFSYVAYSLPWVIPSSGSGTSFFLCFPILMLGELHSKRQNVLFATQQTSYERSIGNFWQFCQIRGAKWTFSIFS